MNRFLTIGLILLDILLFGALPLTAQEIETESEECKSAIVEVENQLKSDRNLTIEKSEIGKPGVSGTPPEARSNGVEFRMSGEAVESIMSSPVLLNTFATQIINSCDSVSAVSFGLSRSGYTQVHGLMPDGEVKLFKCPEDFDDYNVGEYPRSLTWGEFCAY